MSGAVTACRRLADELQGLRDRAGLSLAALASRTPFSKSSWARYLGGKALPPWQAVLALGDLAGAPEHQLRALWELAEAEWSRRESVRAAPEPQSLPATETPETDSTPDEPLAPGTRRPPAGRTLRISAALACVAALGLGASLSLGRQGAPARSAPSPSSAAAGTTPPFRCTGTACDGADPIAMNCGILPESLGIFQTRSGAGMEIRYNPHCHAAWARVWHSQVGDRLSVSVGGKHIRTVRVPDTVTAQTFLYTPMIPVLVHGSSLRACLTPLSTGKPECHTAPVP